MSTRYDQNIKYAMHITNVLWCSNLVERYTDHHKHIYVIY